MGALGGSHELVTPNVETLLKLGANYAPLVREGEVHRLVSSMFLHIGPLHLFLNASALVSVGPSLEARLGRLGFATLYLVSGFLGSVASFVWHLSNPAVSAGASGALCGAIGAGAVLAHKAENPALRGSLIRWGMSTIVFGALVRADNAAHLGGLVSGAALGLFMVRLSPRSETSSKGALLVALVLAAATLGVVRTEAEARTAAGWILEGIERGKAGDKAGERKAFERAVSLEPKSATAHYDLGLVLEEEGDHEQAREHHRRAFLLAPETKYEEAIARTLVNQALGEQNGGSHRRALALLREAQRASPESTRVLGHLGWALYFPDGNPNPNEVPAERAEALDFLRRASARSDGSEFLAHFRALLYWESELSPDKKMVLLAEAASLRVPDGEEKEEEEDEE